MKRFTNSILIALAMLATACMQDNVSPVNDPAIPLVSVDSETMTRIAATMTGSFEKTEGIVSYGFELTSTNFDENPDRIIEVSGLDEAGRFSHTAEVQPGAYYAVRSFISDGHNKKYSKEVSFTAPSTSIATPSDVTIIGDRLYADIVDDGGRTVREVGFCWSESPDNQAIRLRRMKGEWVDSDTFSAALPEMEEGHTYYFLSYAENAADAREAFGYSRTPASYLMTDERYVDIEDPVFRSYLLGRFDKNQDGKLTSKELAVATDIVVNTDQIASIQGIEWMPKLSVLDCRGSSRGKGGLHNVDISHNPLLGTFLCGDNQLTELDLSKAEWLTKLDCRENQLTRLDLSSCFRLADLNCNANSIDALDVTHTPYLRRLAINENPLETIDVSYCTELNRLEGSGCPQLRWVYVSPEQYQTFPNSGDYEIPSSATFYPIFVPIKDDYLYNYLMSVYDQDGDYRISAREAASVTRIEVCSDNVKTMAGIEFFYNLEELICGNCNGQTQGQLTDLDVSQNPKLTYLDCHGNRITQLDLSNNSLLRTLRCSDNQLKSLDVSGLVLLNYLDCGNNQLSRLDVSRNVLLTELHYGQNSIMTIDLSRCPTLEVLDCSSNGVTALDVSGLTGLTELKCSNNQLSVLDVTNNARLTTLWCEGNQLTYLDATKNTRLTDVRTDNVYVPDPVFKDYLLSTFDTDGDEEISLVEAWNVHDINVETQQIYSMEGIQSFVNLLWLICGGGEDENGRQAYGQITSLDLSHAPELIFLDCRYTQLTSLDVSHNPKLTDITCVGNSIESLDLSNQAELTYLDCALNPLGTLDVSHNPKLNYLHCQYAELTSLNLANNPALRELYGSNNELTSLDVTNCPELHRLEFAWNNLEEIDLSNQANLVHLDFRYNNLSALDVSNCPLMNYLDGRGNPDFFELTLRTGQEITTLMLDTQDIEYIYI